MAVIWVVFLLLVGTPEALAQEPAQPDVPTEDDGAAQARAQASSGLLGDQSQAVQDAAAAWEDAWRTTPRLVSLRDAEETGDVEVDIESRLKLLGEKTFSNREWRRYWEHQGATVEAVVGALRQGGGAGELADSLDRWVALSKDKVANQDAFFEAIELERDALEARLESTLEYKATVEEEVAEEVVDDPNPYEHRTIRIEELERQIGSQQTKRALGLAKVAYLERLLETEAILAQALSRDLELAQTELAIAKGMAGTSTAWAELWTEIADLTQGKVDKIAAESDYGRSRQRSREVELGLAKSQISFREGRISTLRDQHDQVTSWSSMMDATGQTIWLWLRNQLWKIALGLLGVYVGVKLALRAVTRGKQLIIERVDDNPDVDDDGDQRRETLADVFASVTRIAIYVVGGLIALEQIGVNTGPLLGSVAILGLAVSFGSQNLVRDVVNGFFILLENQYAVGDVVTTNGQTGTVERITIRSTWVRSYNGTLHCIPNGSISVVSNLTRNWSRSIVNLGVGYGTDLDEVERVINEVGEALYAEEDWAEHLEEAPSFVGVTELADSSVNVRLVCKTRPGQQWGVERELLRRLKVAFDAAGIEIPFPQMVIHNPAA